jgi:hypothetical protein
VPRYHQQGTCTGIQNLKEVLMEPNTFTCSICGERSRDICVFCTKDACINHICERCRRCSDCCECEVPLTRGEQSIEIERNSTPAPEAPFVLDPAEQLIPG